MFFNRIDTKDSQVARRNNHRKVLTTSTTIEKLPTNELKRPLRKKDSSLWTKNTITLQNGNNLNAAIDNKTIVKRGKRTLALEKDKTSPRSVKVLRRSHGQIIKDDKNDGKLRLPSVTVTKTL